MTKSRTNNTKKTSCQKRKHTRYDWKYHFGEKRFILSKRCLKKIKARARANGMTFHDQKMLCLGRLRHDIEGVGRPIQFKEGDIYAFKPSNGGITRLSLVKKVDRKKDRVHVQTEKDASNANWYDTEVCEFTGGTRYLVLKTRTFNGRTVECTVDGMRADQEVGGRMTIVPKN